MEGVDLVQGEVAILKCVQQFSIGTTAGTEGFERESGRTGLTKVGEEQSGQDRFADAGVSSCNEDCFLQTPVSLATDFETDENELRLAGDEGCVLGAFNSKTQSGKNSFHIAFEESGCVEPEAGKNITA